MDTEGSVAPDSPAAASERFDALEPVAASVTNEVAKALLDADEYDERLTDDVVASAHEALFAARLRVHVGTRDEYEDWLAERDVETVELGSENVEHVAWHHAPFADTVVAATYAGQRDAAVETVRRQAVGRVYSEVV